MNDKAGIAASHDFGRDEDAAVKALKKHKVRNTCPSMSVFTSSSLMTRCCIYVCLHTRNCLLKCLAQLAGLYVSAYTKYMYKDKRTIQASTCLCK